MPLLEAGSTQAGTLVSNQNLMHVKFHANRFQDNLLSKRLQQLNSEEMKQRLRHQRTSNELIFFLRECKKTTGYLSKMKSFQSNSCLLPNADETNSSSKTKTFESKSSLDIISRRDLIASKFRSNSYSTHGNYPVPKPRKKFSLDETKIESLNTLKNKIDLKTLKTAPTPKPRLNIFEQILNCSPSSSSAGSSQCSSNSKPPVSSRSNSSTFSSNSSESLNEICKISVKKFVQLRHK